MKRRSYLLIFWILLESNNAIASANTSINEVERLIAFSDKTYTVIVSHYEQTYSYWTGIHKLIARVVDISTNTVISEVVLSSIVVNTSMQEPFESSFSLSDDEQVFSDVLVPPQRLYKNLEFPKYRFHIDRHGVYIEKNGRQDLLDFSVVASRFANASKILDRPVDATYDLEQRINSNDVEFTGWYKSEYQNQSYSFFVLKVGIHEDDTGSLEYVFSIPNK